MQTARIALVGDFSPTVLAHRAINQSIRMVGDKVEPHWLPTSTIRTSDALAYDGIWCVPGSPYVNTEGALWAIEWARTQHVPFLGTCGGFQHALLEFVRHVLGREQAGHAELEPHAPFPLIAPLTCALVEKFERIRPTGRGRFAQWYGGERSEGFCCSFGLNPIYAALLENSPLEVVARGENDEVRAVELREHPFFVCTLFQPERHAMRGELHPLVGAFFESALARRAALG